MFADCQNGKEFLSRLDVLFEQRKKAICNSVQELPCHGRRYYVSQQGNDNNSGLSPEKAWCSLEKVNGFSFSEGDQVLFCRGDVFRGQLKLHDNVTYSAYGAGEKPCIFGSPENGADPQKWKLADKQHNIWEFYKDLLDVGTVVFNNGEDCAYKSLPSFADGKYVVRGAPDFRIYDPSRELSRNLMFFCKCDTEIENGVPAKFAHGKLYLRCDEGNPGEVFKSIEFNTRKNIVEGAFAQNVTVDNLCIKYGGSHGVGAGRVKHLTVQNCEIGWIGGGILYYNKKHEAVRYGNAVEVYTECDGFTVKNNYIYDCYDTGITHQQGAVGGDGVFCNILYEDNLIERCTWSIEYYFGNPDPKNIYRIMKNVVIKNNILRNAGKGFGAQRLTGQLAAHIMGWWFHENRAEDFVICNNVFDRSNHVLLQINAADKKHLPILSGNYYLQNRGGLFGRYGTLLNGQKYEDSQVLYNDEAFEIINSLDPKKKSRFYYL